MGGMSDMDKMQEQIKNDLAELNRLMDRLNMSDKLRQVFKLGNEGGITVKHYKPSSVAVGDKSGYKTEVIYQGEMVEFLPLKEFERLMDCEVEL